MHTESWHMNITDKKYPTFLKEKLKTFEFDHS